jgi:hypothetical protein
MPTFHPDQETSRLPTTPFPNTTSQNNALRSWRDRKKEMLTTDPPSPISGPAVGEQTQKTFETQRR